MPTQHVVVGYKGSAKSGNWNHKGIPGHEGGSAPKGGAVSGAYAEDKKAPSIQSSNTTNAGATVPRLSIPSGQIPDHQKGDSEGKQAYQDWYASLDQKPNLADALAMRKFFADRALEMEGQLSQQSAQEREESRKKRAEEEKNKPKVLTPAEKKAQEKAKKKAASDALKAKKKAEAEAKKKAKAEETAKKKAEREGAAAAKRAEADRKKATAASAAEAKKKAAEEAKAKAAEAKAAAAQAKIEEAQRKVQEKLDAQKKVAEAVGMSEQGLTMFQNAVATLKSGGSLEQEIASALAGAGLIIKSGDSYTVPAAAMSLLSAIMSADAIKARAVLEKLGETGNKEIGFVRLERQGKKIKIG